MGVISVPGVVRIGDKSSGHDIYEPEPLIEGSSNVLVNGKSCGRKGDKYSTHIDHSDIIFEGSSSVFVNGVPIARKGDKLTPDGTVDECSSDVFVN